MSTPPISDGERSFALMATITAEMSAPSIFCMTFRASFGSMCERCEVGHVVVVERLLDGGVHVIQQGLVGSCARASQRSVQALAQLSQSSTPLRPSAH